MVAYGKRIGCMAVVLLFMATGAISDEFQDFAQGEMDSFSQYRDERDAEFVSFLKSQWQEFQAYQGLVRDTTPKPRSLPVVPEAVPTEEPLSPIEEVPVEKRPPFTVVEEIVVPAVPPTLPPEPVEIPVVEPPVDMTVDTPFFVDEPEVPVVEDPFIVVVPPIIDVAEPTVIPEEVVGLSVQFFGAQQAFDGEFQFPEMDLSPPFQKQIADYWDGMSRSKYKLFLTEVRSARETLALNDWGYHALLFQVGLELHRGDRDLANLFSWFMSVKSGYDARVGYSDERVYLLLPSRNRLYGVNYLTLKGTRYYAMTFDGTKESLGRLYTYKANYPRSNRLMDYRILKVPALTPDIVDKELSFTYTGEPQMLRVSYNRSLVDYYRNYPQTNIKIYFDATTSKELDYTMVRELKKALEGKDEVEAVNYLLGFVQKAFEYKTDDAQLGREKYMLPEETLWYPYSDCEDRSFLFAYLVRKILKLDVVGLNYPGHVATAVRFSDNVSGDYVVLNNRKYIVCDPTYINASAGMAMPKYKRRNPNVVTIKNWQ